MAADYPSATCETFVIAPPRSRHPLSMPSNSDSSKGFNVAVSATLPPMTSMPNRLSSGKPVQPTASSSQSSQPLLKASIGPLQQMVSSCSGALVTSTLMTPFDVVKIRVQASAASETKCPRCAVYFNGLMDHVCPPNCKPLAPPPWYKLNGASGAPGAFRSLTRIVQHEGPLVLWSGLPPTLLMAVPSTVIYFTAYDNLKSLLGFEAPPPGVFDRRMLVPFFSGAGARLAAVSVISPLELIRTKMQSQKLSYTQVGTAVREAVALGGLRSLWSGWVPSVLRDVPFSALYFCGYELFKIHYTSALAVDLSAENDAGIMKVNFLSGASSAFFATVLTQPFDVLKTRIQIKLGNAGFGAVATETTWQRASEIVRRQGLAGLYAGLVPRLVKIIPACAIMITSYEYFKEVFAARNARRGLS